MKTTKEIINDELGVILNSVDYDVNNALFEINKNKRWWSEEELKEKLILAYNLGLAELSKEHLKDLLQKEK